MTFQNLSKSSRKKIATCHQDLQNLIENVSKRLRIQVIEGHRSKERHAELLALGLSKTQNSKHLKRPSMAVDIAPLKENGSIDWNDTESFISLSKIVFEEASKLNVKIRWGGDFNMNGDWKDEKFRDFVHYEKA